jgi:hypothetical protein
MTLRATPGRPAPLRPGRRGLLQLAVIEQPVISEVLGGMHRSRHSNRTLSATTELCRAPPARFVRAQGRSAKVNVHKSVHNRRENGPRGRTSGAISASSGDRIRTCDLWVMSRPVAVSRIPRRLIRAGKRTALVSVVASDATASRRFRGVLFPNLFPSQTSRSSHWCIHHGIGAELCVAARGHQGCVIGSAGRPEITIPHGPLAIRRWPPPTMSVTEGT